MATSAERRSPDLQAAPDRDAPIRAIVYGSCVARDVIRVVPEPFEVTGYIARQSFVSAFTDPVEPPELPNVASPFQARNVRGDFWSDAGARIADLGGDADVVLIDIASDRHGVAAYGDGYVSLTPDHRRAFRGIVPGGTAVPFGSSEHLSLFTQAARQGRALLKELSLFEKTLVIGAPFTDRTVTGEPMTGAAETAEAINEKYRPYYEALSAAGFSIAMLPDELAVADLQHAWGPGQDHYADPAYRWWAEQVSTFARRKDEQLTVRPRPTLSDRIKGLLGQRS